MSDSKTFTGRLRHRQTRRSVRIVDRVARTLIALGGIGTVIAVSTVCIFLVCVAVPLFLPASYAPAKSWPLSPALANCLHFETDEYRAVGWAMSPDAVLRTFRLDTGEVIHERTLFPDQKPTAWSFGVGGREAICGFADGSVRTIRLGFTTTFPDEGDIPESVRSEIAVAPAVYDGGLIWPHPAGSVALANGTCGGV